MQEEKSPDVKHSHFLKNLSFGGNSLGLGTCENLGKYGTSLELLGFSLKNTGTLRREISCL